MSNKTPRELLANRVVKMIYEIGDIIDKNMSNDDAALELTCKIHHYADLSGYLNYSTDEILNAQYHQETKILPNCPIAFTGGLENEPKYPLKTICPHIECLDRETCWAAYTLEPGVTDLTGEFNAEWDDNAERTPI